MITGNFYTVHSLHSLFDASEGCRGVLYVYVLSEPFCMEHYAHILLIRGEPFVMFVGRGWDKI